MQKLRRLAAVCAVTACSLNLYSQDAPQLPDSPSQAKESVGQSPESPTQRDLSWRTFPHDFLQDQKAIWLFPVQLAKGHHLLPTLAVVGGTAGLLVADSHAMPYFRTHARNL